MEKEYLVLMQNMQANSNGLLGEFIDDDKYQIKDSFKQDLKICNKLIKTYKQDKIEAVATVGSFNLNFEIYIQQGEKNRQRATLMLLEKAKIDMQEKEFLTLIAPVIIEPNETLMEVIKKEFHAYVLDESTGIDMTNATLLSLIEFMNKTKKKSNYVLEELMQVDKAYVLRVLKLLKSEGSLGEQFILQLKNHPSLLKLDKNSKAYWRNMKILLDSLIKENSGALSKNTLQKILDLQAGYKHMALNVKEPQITKSSSSGKSKDAGGGKKAGGKKPGGKKSEAKKSAKKTQGKPEKMADSKKVPKFSNIKPKEKQFASRKKTQRDVSIFNLMNTTYDRELNTPVKSQTNLNTKSNNLVGQTKNLDDGRGL